MDFHILELLLVTNYVSVKYLQRLYLLILTLVFQFLVVSLGMKWQGEIYLIIYKNHKRPWSVLFSWLEQRPVYRKVTGSISRQGESAGLGLQRCSQLMCLFHIAVSLTLSQPSFLKSKNTFLIFWGGQGILQMWCNIVIYKRNLVYNLFDSDMINFLWQKLIFFVPWTPITI